MISDQLVTTGGGVAMVSFTSVPNTYKHLKLFVVAKTTRGTAGDSMLIQFNSDTTVGNYFTQRLVADATTVTASELSVLRSPDISQPADGGHLGLEG